MQAELPETRAQIKRKRRELSPAAIDEAADRICRLLWANHAFRNSRNIAAYMPVSGEVDCHPIIETAILRKKRIFLPVLVKNRLRFAPYTRGSSLVLNRYKILEPVHQISDLIEPSSLDTVLAPLVAFDANLNRIGMGGGYYDRSLAFLNRRRIWKRPRVIGLAYSFQQIAAFEPQPWDVPMDAVVTERKIFQ